MATKQNHLREYGNSISQLRAPTGCAVRALSSADGLEGCEHAVF